MSLPSHHPFSLAYTANPHPTFERAHRGDDFIEVPEMKAILDHLPSNARVFGDGITWDPGNLSLRELTALPVEIS